VGSVTAAEIIWREWSVDLILNAALAGEALFRLDTLATSHPRSLASKTSSASSSLLASLSSLDDFEIGFNHLQFRNLQTP
jgi:hypothetical protein